MYLAYTWNRYQVSVYRSIGPLVYNVFYVCPWTLFVGAILLFCLRCRKTYKKYRLNIFQPDFLHTTLRLSKRRVNEATVYSQDGGSTVSGANRATYLGVIYLDKNRECR